MLLRKRVWLFLNICILILGLFIALINYYTVHYNIFEGISHNSDLLYIPDIYNDIIRGVDIHQWQLPPSLFLFPDTMLYLIIRPLTPNISAAIMTLGMAQYLLFALGLMILARNMLPISYGLARYTLIALMGMLFIALIGQLELYSQLIFMQEIHAGAVVSAPFSIAITGSLIKEPRLRKTNITGLFLLSVLNSISDNIYIVQLLIPTLLILVVLFMKKSISLKRFMLLGGLISASIISGLMMTFILASISMNPAVSAHFFHGSVMLSSAMTLFRSFGLVWFTNPLHVILATVFIVICFILSFKYMISSKTETAGGIESWLPLFFVASFLVNLVAVLAFGSFTNASCFRYFLPLLIFTGFWGWPFIVKIPQIVNIFVLECTTLIFMIVSASMLLMNASPSQFVDHFSNQYYPDYIQCLDQKTAQLGLHNGLAQYWQARPISLLSHGHLLVAQVKRDLSPFYWITNISSFNIKPEFIIIDQSLPVNSWLHIDEKNVLRRFGAPDTIFECGQNKVMVYKNPASRLRMIFAKKP